jgi:hypothetical protein
MRGHVELQSINVEAEVLALARQRAEHLRPDLFFYREFTRATAQTIAAISQLMGEFAAQHRQPYQLLVDLSDARPPGAQERDLLKQMMAVALPLLTNCVAWTGSNFLINTAARFVLRGTFPRGSRLVSTRDEAYRLVGYTPPDS